MLNCDIFCRVVDNFGDIGVCWRLARQLANEYGARVRLWVDRLEAFAALRPVIVRSADAQHVDGIDIRRWDDEFPVVDAADVVIEAFACELPARYLTAMATKCPAPVWINLDYLSAESWVEGCHLGRSPSAGGLPEKHFFFPGFAANTGGLLRERGLLEGRARFDLEAQREFWKSVGVAPPQAGELRVSLFCYENSALPELLRKWSEGPASVTVLATPGPATSQIAKWSGADLAPGNIYQQQSLTVYPIAFLPPDQYDRLLWACDVNFVRGEDSFLRAQWAQKPFVWQIYPQAEGAHLAKLDAFLNRYLQGTDQAVAVARFWHAWNERGEIGPAWQEFATCLRMVKDHTIAWVSRLDRNAHLADNLVQFARAQSNSRR
jgi:uncharacterized repeat protein (TIGR03837 family)